MKKPQNITISKAHVFLSPTENFAANHLLPPYKEKELQQTSSPLAAAQSRGGWGLLQTAARDILGVTPPLSLYTRNENGKPIHPWFCFSISHTKDLLAVAVSPLPIGVDLEQVAGPALDLSQIALPEEQTKNPYLLWTKKEAVFKKNGARPLFQPRSINTEAYETESRRLHFRGHDFFLTAAVALPVCWHLDFEKEIKKY